ncbi:Uncharacterized protein DBV15_00017, partial [Temnothorax longispinosus]
FCKRKKRDERKSTSARTQPCLAYHRDLSVHLSPTWVVFEKVVIREQRLSPSC